jgi:xylan 1,4-beta-xylosidase
MRHPCAGPRVGRLSAWFRQLLLIGTLTIPALGQAAVREVTIDFARTNGVIRPLHGVNLGPLCYRGMVDLSAYHRELGVPFTRLHDVVWVNAEAVDIHTLFPDFGNDPSRPESYRFAATDDYLKSIVRVGSGIIYRLGESIEHTPRQYWVHPPADPEKWAAICVGVVRHFNEGWADGFQHNIRYWEIWNEPDVRPQMWTGTDEQFFRLYAATARAIKSRFPHLKVGGPAVGGTGEFREGRFVEAAFAARFLDFCQSNTVPLDFFSWHRYTADPLDIPRRARAVREMLDRRGFTATESHFNEWNYLPREDWGPMLPKGAGQGREAWFAEMGGPKGAAFAATVLSLLQDCPVDVANYYTGEIQGFGLFTFHGAPRKTYHAFKAFRALLETPSRVALPPSKPDDITLLCGLAHARDKAQVLVSNFNVADETVALRFTGLPWPGTFRYSMFQVGDSKDLEEIRAGALGTQDVLELPGRQQPWVVLIQLGVAARE